MTSLWGSLFLGSFLNEDLSITASIFLFFNDRLDIYQCGSSIFLGVFLSNLAFFVLGRLLQKHFPEKVIRFFDYKISNYHLINYFIYICRVLPLLRVPTYFFAGVSRQKWTTFVMHLAFSVFLWVASGLLMGRGMQRMLIDARYMVVAFVLLTIVFVHLILFYASLKNKKS